MPNYAFCENCGNRVAVGGENATRKYCGFCATPEGRKKQKEDQAAIEHERLESSNPSA